MLRGSTHAFVVVVVVVVSYLKVTPTISYTSSSFLWINDLALIFNVWIQQNNDFLAPTKIIRSLKLLVIFPHLQPHLIPHLYSKQKHRQTKQFN